MTLRIVNVLLLILLAAVGILGRLVEKDPARPNFEILPEMVHSIPYDSFARNPVFPDGKTLQRPMEGTIPRGELPLHFEATPEDAARAGEELVNAYSPQDEVALKRGKRVFEAFCQPCHGPGGQGDGVVALHGYPAPPSLLAPEATALKDGQIFHIVTFGKGNMPPHRAQVAREDRWRVILHIRWLQAQGSRPQEPLQTSN